MICVEDIRHKHNKHRKTDTKKRTAVDVTAHKEPLLAEVARAYWSAPCTSVNGERLFSAASHMLDEKRNRPTCDKAEMLLFVKKINALLKSQK